MDSIVDDAIDEDEQETEERTDPTNQPSQSMRTDSSDYISTSDTEAGMTNAELEEVADNLNTNTSITVVGCGGGGCNTINRMVEEDIEGCTFAALNTDVQHLLEVNSDNKLLIGEKTTQGRGAGSVPKQGEEAALENEQDIQDIVQGEDMVFVTAGMGGGTGTGAAPVVAEAAKESGALTISIVTLPFTSEGEVRRTNAEAGLERLRQVSDTVIVIPNDRLLKSVGEVPIEQAFRVCDEVLMRSVKGITEMITKSGLVNLDFADVKTTMENGGVAMIGLGESQSNDSGDVVSSAVSSPLLDVDISSADSVLVNVTGGDDMSIEQAEGVVEDLHDRVDPAARIIWGTGIDKKLNDTIRALVVVTGVESNQIYGKDGEPGTSIYEDQTEDNPDGIDYIS